MTAQQLSLTARVYDFAHKKDWEMTEDTPTKPPTHRTDFEVWGTAARQIGTARRNADGAIIIKLDPGEVVRSGALFLYPVQQ
jgi:hypothetical protein